MAAPMKFISGALSRLKTSEILKPSRFFLRPYILNGTDYSTNVSNSAVGTDDNELDSLYKRVFVEIKSYEPAVMDSYQKFVTMVANELDINLPKVHVPAKKYTLERRTLLKSIHIYKKHRKQYEIRTHYKTFEFSHLTGSTADTLLEYIQRNLPEGVAMKVTKHKMERLPSHFLKESTS